MPDYRDLDELGRIQLSRSFFFRDFLFSEISAAYSVPNVPDDLDLAVYTGRKLCAEVLEPLQEAFGRIHIRSGFRSSTLNAFGNARGLNCSRNEATFADHIWDQRDEKGNTGACACIVIPWFLERHGANEWERLAWWLFDNIDFHRVVFFGRQASFNIGVRDNPIKEIMSHVAPRGRLTGPGMLNAWGSHAEHYEGFPGGPLQRVARAREMHSCTPLQFTRDTLSLASSSAVTSDRTSTCDGISVEA